MSRETDWVDSNFKYYDSDIGDLLQREVILWGDEGHPEAVEHTEAVEEGLGDTVISGYKSMH